ncbi:uncharacterized protein METZ01_LOCUS424066 [marine metagenome]|uniref:Uncharacterized protein n=1 Tax=marine metagenome TaxID=408172 RepID=A0A382XJB5_9ZZZZ
MSSIGLNKVSVGGTSGSNEINLSKWLILTIVNWHVHHRHNSL